MCTLEWIRETEGPLLLPGFLPLGWELALHCWDMLPHERAEKGCGRGGMQICALPVGSQSKGCTKC